jgi:hypothetical protein
MRSALAIFPPRPNLSGRMKIPSAKNFSGTKDDSFGRDQCPQLVRLTQE